MVKGITFSPALIYINILNFSDIKEVNIINKEINNHLLHKFDILFIAFFSLTPISKEIIPNDIVLHYWFPIFSVLFFVAAIPYIDSIKKYFTLVLISFISGVIVANLYSDHFHGYGIIFFLLYLKIFVVSSVVGFISAKYCWHQIERRLFNKKELFLWAGFIVLFLAVGIASIIFDVSSENKLHGELRKRYQLAENISAYYNRSRNKNINNQVVIEQKLIGDLYSGKEGIISHGYGGNIIASSDHKGISLVYEGIPENEACNMFDYFSSPNIYGFDDTFVNDVLVRSRVNYKNIINSKDICYESDDKVTIRYTGSYENFDRASKYLR
ncbi:hypothetical protein CXF85_08910 [Colwellia sp. 75C3]|uniref:hypothetical protein n=1 Tax=Colwellia sp. 75C3 TaxID=888425 RepID=UPI000C31FEA6|nr:hypothetical protein [Colwellia sp. 75C3]PKG84214.1 hypothetical protein CXF85_08910 [Colwellia sp. 75C3]